MSRLSWMRGTSRASPTSWSTRLNRLVAAGRGRSWPVLIATATAAAWAAVGVAGGATLGAWRVDTAGAAAAAGLAAILAATVTVIPSDLLAPYAVALVTATAAVAAAASAAAELVEQVDGSAPLAFVLAAGAAVAAGRDRWLAAVVGMAFGAAAAGEPTAFWLLGAAAAVAAAVHHPAALVTVLPGTALVVDAAVAGGGPGRVAVATAAVATGAWCLRGVRRPPRLAVRQAPALAIAAALLVVPHTWTWTGMGALEAELLRGTAIGVGLAVVVGGIAVTLGWVSGQIGAPRWEAASP